MLVVLGEPEDESVVLAAECDGGRLPVVRLEDLDGPPAVLRARGDDSRDAAFFEAQSELARADRQAVPRDAGVALVSQSSRGRQVGCGAATRMNLPLAFGSHFTNSVLSAKRGRMIVLAVRPFFPLPGL